ncbi:MAG: BglG family transcription antiterminator [Tissierellia bacterium]|nr:BglG family transcription antiterminator [Tissierellia bacterium]
MKQPKLSQRQKNIIHIISDSDKEYITVKDIADNLDISTRTVQRDLVGIEEFLFENDFDLIKKPGKGLMLNENKQAINYLYELLDMIDSSKQYEKTERVNFILSRLLTSKQAIKYFAFSVYLDISEKTLSEDLNFIEKWLSIYDIKLIRKRGEGISIQGEERAIRKAQARLINEVLNDDKKLEILRGINDDTKVDFIRQNDVLSMIDRNIMEKTKNALNNVFAKLNISLSDNSYIGLLVHISLAIERLKQNKKLDYSENIINNLKDSKEYIFAEKIIEELEKEFEIEIPEFEVYYVAMHIKGAKIIGENQKENDVKDIIEAYQISDALINRMQEIFKLDLKSDLRLEEDLKTHLIPALTRLKFNFNIKNPILDEIKEKYNPIFLALKKISPKIFNDISNISINNPIPDDEIGYIAIHFITSIERKIVETVSINVLIVCPTGYGTSMLLATNFRNHLNNINIVGNASVMKLNKKYLEDNKIDLIVSTVDIDNIIEENNIKNIDYIEMPAIPSEKDYVFITTKLKKLSREKYYSKNLNLDSKITDKSLVKDDSYTLAQEIYNVSNNLNRLFDDIRFFTKEKSKDLHILSAKIISDNKIEYEKIKKALIDREKISTTYFEEYKLHLLHAKCDIEKPKLAFGKIKDSNQNIIVMISNKINNEEIIKLFSLLSSEIIENENFFKAIESFNENEIRKTVLNKIYIIIDSKINLGGKKWHSN